jgi:cytoskeletal protein CcmA (bactofilin family)
MNCFSEFTYSVYSDRELPAAEARQVEAHLETCPRCRALVNTLHAESRIIADVLAEAREELAVLPEMQAASPSRLILGMLVALAGVILAFRAMLVGVSEWGLSQLGLLEPFSKAIEWLDPNNMTARLNLMFTGVFFIVNEGASMLPWLLTAVGSVLFVAALVAASIYVARRRPARFHSVAIFGFILALLIVPRASAVEIHKNEPNFTLPAGKTINETLMIGGDVATIDGDVNGNVIFGGRHITIRGHVKGDVFCGDQSTEIEGTVDGNVIAFSQWTSITGKVGGSVYNWSQTSKVSSSAVIAGDLLSFAADTEIGGDVGRDLLAFSGNTFLTARTGHDVTVRGDSLTVASSAKIGGDLTAYLRHPDRAKIENPASVTGKTSIQQAERGSMSNNDRFTTGNFYFWQLIQLLGALIVGALLMLMYPSLYNGAKRAVGFTWMPLLRNLGIGFGVLIAAPVAMVLVCITLVGIPLSILTLMVYIAGLYFAKIFLGAMIGEAILQRPSLNTQDSLVALLVGLAVYFVAVNLPFAVGPTLHFIAFCIGLGAFGYRLVMPVHDNV